MTVDTKKLGALNRLDALDREIERVTRSFREDWIFLEPIEGKPGRAIRRLKVEHQAEYSRLQKELVRLQEMRAELRRELNLDLGEMYGT